jgi:hypothetical protein
MIAAGIGKVSYIEPYAKSRASGLHPDEISVDREEAGKVPFLAFVGVGPRRSFAWFSLTLSTGYPIERKEDGKLIPWSRATAAVRLQVKPSTYLQRELPGYGALKGIRSSHGWREIDPRDVLEQNGPRDPSCRQIAGLGQGQSEQRTAGALRPRPVLEHYHPERQRLDLDCRPGRLSAAPVKPAGRRQV